MPLEANARTEFVFENNHFGSSVGGGLRREDVIGTLMGEQLSNPTKKQ